jgi:hypothetical protein
MGQTRFCAKCSRDRPLGRFRHRAVVEDAERDLWCRSCERLHWGDYVGTVAMMRALAREGLESS